MQNKYQLKRGFEVEQECLGYFNTDNPVCSTQCVLRLRCAVLKEQLVRLELIEELTADLVSYPTIQ